MSKYPLGPPVVKDAGPTGKKRFVKLTNFPIILQDSDGEKSDDLVVDVSNEVSSAACNCKWHIDMY